MRAAARRAPASPQQIAGDDHAEQKARDIAWLLGEGSESRVGVVASHVVEVLDALIESGLARWHAGGRKLGEGRNAGIRLRRGRAAAAAVWRDRGRARAMVC